VFTIIALTDRFNGVVSCKLTITQKMQ